MSCPLPPTARRTRNPPVQLPLRSRKTRRPGCGDRGLGVGPHLLSPPTPARRSPGPSVTRGGPARPPRQRAGDRVPRPSAHALPPGPPRPPVRPLPRSGPGRPRGAGRGLGRGDAPPATAAGSRGGERARRAPPGRRREALLWLPPPPPRLRFSKLRGRHSRAAAAAAGPLAPAGGRLLARQTLPHAEPAGTAAAASSSSPSLLPPPLGTPPPPPGPPPPSLSSGCRRRPGVSWPHAGPWPRSTLGHAPCAPYGQMDPRTPASLGGTDTRAPRPPPLLPAARERAAGSGWGHRVGTRLRAGAGVCLERSWPEERPADAELPAEVRLKLSIGVAGNLPPRPGADPRPARCHPSVPCFGSEYATVVPCRRPRGAGLRTEPEPWHRARLCRRTAALFLRAPAGVGETWASALCGRPPRLLGRNDRCFFQGERSRSGKMGQGWKEAGPLPPS